MTKEIRVPMQADRDRARRLFLQQRNGPMSQAFAAHVLVSPDSYMPPQIIEQEVAREKVAEIAPPLGGIALAEVS